MAVRWCAHDRLGCDVATAARPVVDDKWLAEPLRQPSTYKTRGDVRRATGWIAVDQLHRPRRIGLCPSEARSSGDGGSTRGRVKKISAGKPHAGPHVPPRKSCADAQFVDDEAGAPA